MEYCSLTNALPLGDTGLGFPCKRKGGGMPEAEAVELYLENIILGYMNQMKEWEDKGGQGLQGGSTHGSQPIPYV